MRFELFNFGHNGAFCSRQKAELTFWMVRKGAWQLAFVFIKKKGQLFVRFMNIRKKLFFAVHCWFSTQTRSSFSFLYSSKSCALGHGFFILSNTRRAFLDLEHFKKRVQFCFCILTRNSAWFLNCSKGLFFQPGFFSPLGQVTFISVPGFRHFQ